MIRTIGRKISKEYTQEERENRYKYDRCNKNGLVCEGILEEKLGHYNNYFVRYCSDPYTGRSEHLILLKKGDYGKTDLWRIYKHLQKQGYHILQNPPSHQSQPNIWHVHLLKLPYTPIIIDGVDCHPDSIYQVTQVGSDEQPYILTRVS